MRASIRTVAACGVLLACGGCDALPPPIARPDVLLFSLDTTRADRIGAYGHAAASTPTFDALARDGVLFESAYSPTPITLPAHASMLTGLYPSAHGVRDNGLFALGPDATLVSEVFAAHGWRTGAFVGSFAVDERTGLAQGFEIYSDKGSETRGIVPERTADAVAKDAIAWLETLAPEDNFFLWLHFYDPHLPFAAPEPWRSRNADPYDAEIAFADAQLARVLRSIETRGSDAPLLVVATSDHGEGLGDHGEGSHGVLLYQGTVRVPLVISGPHVARSPAPGWCTRSRSPTSPPLSSRWPGCRRTPCPRR